MLIYCNTGNEIAKYIAEQTKLFKLQVNHPDTISTTIDKINAAHVTVCRNQVIPGLRCLVALSRLLDDQNQRGIVVTACCESFHDMTFLSKIVLNYFA